MRSQRWFQRRRVGLGWRPADWHGWAITALTIAAVVAVLTVLRTSSARIPVAILIFAVYAVVALATGGARPPEAAPSAAEPTEVDEPGETETGSGNVAEQRQALRALTSGRTPASSHDEPALVVEHLSKRFGERLAVDDVSFSVGAGEVFGFLGPNGAGKTTTVRMLATVIAPTSGTARVARLPLEAANGVEIRKRIAVMTENPGLYLASHRRREPRVLRRAVRARTAEGADRSRRWRRSISPPGPTISAAASRRGCASGSRSHARCSTIQRSSSSTSRPPGSTRSHLARYTS